MREDLHGHSLCGELIGTKILRADAERGEVEAAYEAKQQFTNRIGTVSGGMLSAMLDSITGLAALAALPEDLVAAHTSLKVEYLRAACPGRLVGRGRVLERVDRDIRSEGELVDADGQVLARGEATLRTVRKRRS